jgi:hypothetical protein
MQPIKLDKRTEELLKDDITPFKSITENEGVKVIHAVQLNQQRIQSLELLTNKKISNITTNDYVSFIDDKTLKSTKSEFENKFKPFASKETQILAEHVRKLSEERKIDHPAAILAEGKSYKDGKEQRARIKNRN